MPTYGVEVPFVDHCGIVDAPAKGDRTYVELVLGPEHQNHLGIAHGGVLCTLLDVAMGTCARRVSGRPVVTLSMQTNFIKPARGKLTAEGLVLRAGRAIVFCEATVSDDAHDVIATGSGTFKTVPNLS